MINEEHKSADFAYIISEKIAYKFFAPIFYRLPFSPNQLSVINFVFNNLPAVIFFSLGKYWANLVAVAFIVMAVVWDWMDGAVARKKALSSKGGAFLDPALDFIWQHLLIAGICVGVYRNSGNNFFWLVIGFLAVVFLAVGNYFVEIFYREFGFGFRADYDEFFKEIDSFKKTTIFEKFLTELLTFRKFAFIFFFTVRYPLLLGALTNKLNIFLIFLIISFVVRSISLFYLYFIYLELKKESAIVKALVNRRRYWLDFNKGK